MSMGIKYLVDIIAMIAIYIAVLYKKWKIKGRDTLLVNTLMYVYIGLVLYVTLMPIITSIPFILNYPYRPISLLPFDDYFHGRGDTVRQIVLNMVMMIPFGFLLPIVKKQDIFTCIARTLMFSLSIELLQPLINGFRSADITDVITNTVGGIIGYLLYLLFKPIVNVVLQRVKSGSTKA
ncbi:hypothetical protein OBV_44370 [Oscillibacter valericigenes Sjm18-20]|nr:hypothetical protein OBV_44370 [Oscillibacter valericigenes Sjm18-20]